MTTIRFRYFVTKAGRHYWQPSTALRAGGWQPQRLSDDRERAIAEAEAINRDLDAWREGQNTAPGPATIKTVIAKYKQSGDWHRLAASSRRTYAQCLACIEDWAGDVAPAVITPKRVKVFYEALRAPTPSKANYVIRVLRVLFNYAISEDLAAINPAQKVKLIGTGAKGRIWSPAAVAAFVAEADAKGRHSIGTAVMLNEWIGQREGDLITMPRSAYRDGVIRLTQSKTGAQVVLPIDMVPALLERLEAEFERQGQAKVTATTIIVNETTGRPYTADNFRHVLAGIREAAAARAEREGQAELARELRALEFRHLRHTAITRLAEVEVGIPLIANISGHSFKSADAIIDRYAVRTEKMARTAFAKRLKAEKENETGP